MLHLLLLLLAGTIYAEEPGICPQDVLDKQIVPDVKMAKCEMPEILDSAPLADCSKEHCPNASLALHGDVCPGKGSCHIRIIICPKTYAEALQVCRCHRGNLSSIHSQCVNNQVRVLAQRTCGNRFGWVWIGVYKPVNSCHYVNADGSRLDYTNWACGNPITSGGWCTALNLGSGQWHSINCGYQLPSICTY